jgi:hypothetical protein
MGMTNRHSALVLRVIGATATAVAIHDLLRGVARVRRGPNPDLNRPADIDSELRFGSAWYLTAGALMMHAARTPASEKTTIRFVSTGWLVAGVGRVLSIRAHGRPHLLYLVLMVAEFMIAGLLFRGQHVLTSETDKGITDAAVMR